MKRTTLLTLALGLIVLLSPVWVYSQGQTNLSSSSKMSELPFIIIRPNGQIIVAWCEGGHFNAGGHVAVRTKTGGGAWSAEQAVAKTTSAFPQLALDKEGDVHMAYWEGDGSYTRDIYYLKYRNGQWSGRELVYDSWGFNSSWQRINVDGNRIYVLWCHNYKRPSPMDVVLIEKNDGGSFPANYQDVSRHSKSTSIHPFLKVKNGNVYAAWMDDNHGAGNWNIYYAERINGHWSNPKRINPGPNQYCPAVEVDNSGNVHLIYSNRGGPIFYMKKVGSSWSTPKIISTAGTSITTFNFMKLANGMLHALWRQREGNGNYIHYTRGNLAGNWETPLKVSHAGEGEYPGLDVDKQGNVHVVYSDLGVAGQRDVFYIRVDQVTSFPVASFSANPTQGNPPLEVIFDASASYDPDGKIVRYRWDFGDGDSDTTTYPTTSHIYIKKGTHTAKLTVTDDEDQSSDMTMNITVGVPPIAKISASPTSGGKPLTVHFDGSASTDPDGSIVSYHWNYGDGHSGNGPMVSHTYNSNATRTATLTVKDNEGLEDKASVEIKISAGAIANFSCTPKRGKAPLKVNFDASNSKPSNKQSGKIVKYEWDFGDGTGASSVKPSHTYKKAGVYMVTLRVTDNEGSQGSTTKDITVFTLPVASFTCNPTNGVAPLRVTFDASSSTDQDGHIVNYKWTFGDGTTGTGKTVSHTYTKGGGITIWLVVTDNDGWTNGTSRQIEVIERPFAPKNFSVNNLAHEGLFFNNYINVLTWKHNPKNSGKIQIVNYIIFRKKRGTSNFVYQTTVSPHTTRWEDHKLTSKEDMHNYIYGIRAVDAYGRESDMKKADSGS